MTTALAFMVARVEEKIVYPDVETTTPISVLKTRLLPDLQSHNVAVEQARQIRLIYSGRILKDTDQVASLVNPSIEPPYTLQVLVRPLDASNTPNPAPQLNRPSQNPCSLF
jgi:hypothetical protein